MIHVLVVEDEPPILRNLCRKIEKLHPDFKIVGTAFHGKEAIQFLESHTVDIVFTDISMPILGGIDLLKYTSENMPLIRTVLISGYQEFTYAQSAIKYGAVDYILKPVDDTQLSILLNRLYKEYNQNQKRNAQYMLYDTFPVQQNHLPASTSAAGNSEPLYMLLLCVGSVIPASAIPADEFPSSPYIRQIEEVLGKAMPHGIFYWIFAGKSENERVVIFKELDAKELQKIIHIVQALFCNFSFPVNVAISCKIDGMSEIKQKYLMLKKILRKYIFFGESNTIFENSLSKYDIYDHSNAIANSQLSVAVHKKSLSQVLRILSDILLQFKQQKISQLQLEIFLRNTLLYCCRENFIEMTLLEIEGYVQNLVCSCLTFDDLQQKLADLLRSSHTKTAGHNSDTTVLIEKIDKYICSHLAEPITNQTLSTHFGLSPSYLSRLFKEKKELSPSEYVTYLRIKMAKQLMQQSPSLLIKDIAQIVGYSDPLYFSRVFKKSEGIYPSEYLSNITSKSKGDSFTYSDTSPS